MKLPNKQAIQKFTGITNFSWYVFLFFVVTYVISLAINYALVEISIATSQWEVQTDMNETLVSYGFNATTSQYHSIMSNALHLPVLPDYAGWNFLVILLIGSFFGFFSIFPAVTADLKITLGKILDIASELRALLLSSVTVTFAVSIFFLNTASNYRTQILGTIRDLALNPASAAQKLDLTAINGDMVLYQTYKFFQQLSLLVFAIVGLVVFLTLFSPIAERWGPQHPMTQREKTLRSCVVPCLTVVSFSVLTMNLFLIVTTLFFQPALFP